MDSAHAEDQTFRDRHPVAWYGVAFGVIAGVALAAAGAGKITQGQELLVVVGAFAAGFCYAFAGGFTAGRSFSARDGLKAGLLAGAISALISVPVDLVCTRVFMSIYLPHMQELQRLYNGPEYVMTPAMVFASEIEGVFFGTVAALFFGGILGWIGGYFGSSMRQRWALAETPTPTASAPSTLPPADASAPVIPSGPRWESAHQPSPPAES